MDDAMAMQWTMYKIRHNTQNRNMMSVSITSISDGRAAATFSRRMYLGHWATMNSNKHGT